MRFQCLSDWQSVPELFRLSDLSRPPKRLFISQPWKPEIFANAVAVVGSRRITEYGRRVLDRMIPMLVEEGKTIVSGFMYGVDRYAHDLAVRCKGKTVAVLGWGIERTESREDEIFAKRIVEAGGALLSEWDVQKPALWTFPVRNRIVAALSTDVIVVEAAAKSGSLITAACANTLSRTLWAVPGPITSRYSEGTNTLIAQGKAKVWLGGNVHADTCAMQEPLLSVLGDASMTVDELSRATGESVATVGAKLTVLSMRGRVVEREGKYYVGQN